MNLYKKAALPFGRTACCTENEMGNNYCEFIPKTTDIIGIIISADSRMAPSRLIMITKMDAIIMAPIMTIAAEAEQAEEASAQDAEAKLRLRAAAKTIIMPGLLSSVLGADRSLMVQFYRFSVIMSRLKY